MKSKIISALFALLLLLLFAWLAHKFMNKRTDATASIQVSPASSSSENDPEETRILALLQNGYSLLESDKSSEALELFSRVRLDAEQQLTVVPEGETGLVLLAAANIGLCNVAIRSRDLDTAQKHLKDASLVLDQLATKNKKAIHQILSTSCDIMTAELAMIQDDIYLASDSYISAIGKLHLLILRNPERLIYHHDLATCHRQIGRIFQERGLLLKASESYLKALEIAEFLHKSEPRNSDYFQDIAAYNTDAGRVAGIRKDFEAAVAHYSSALEIRKSLATLKPLDPERQSDLSVAHMNLGILAEDEGNVTASRKHYERSYDAMKPLVESGAKASDHDKEILEALKRKAGINMR